MFGCDDDDDDDLHRGGLIHNVLFGTYILIETKERP
jgi:hypothetical protein